MKHFAAAKLPEDSVLLIRFCLSASPTAAHLAVGISMTLIRTITNSDWDCYHWHSWMRPKFRFQIQSRVEGVSASRPIESIDRRRSNYDNRGDAFSEKTQPKRNISLTVHMSSLMPS